MFEEEYASLDAIPAAVRHLYKKAGDKYVLLQAGEVKTQGDIDNVREGLRKEREDHKETKRLLGQFNGLDPEEVHTKLDRIEELEAAAGNKIDEAKMNELVEARVRSRVAPIQRQLDNVVKERDTLKGTVTEFEKKDVRRAIRDDISKAAIAAKVRDTALEDVLVIGENIFTVNESGQVVTKDGVGVTPGIDASVWFTEVKNNKPHWWPESQGAGARSGTGQGGANNPFSAEHWNMTEQGKLVVQDRSRAEQLAKSAGTTIGGAKPAPRK